MMVLYHVNIMLYPSLTFIDPEAPVVLVELGQNPNVTTGHGRPPSRWGQALPIPVSFRAKLI